MYGKKRQTQIDLKQKTIDLNKTVLSVFNLILYKLLL